MVEKEISVKLKKSVKFRIMFCLTGLILTFSGMIIRYLNTEQIISNTVSGLLMIPPLILFGFYLFRKQPKD